MRPIEQVFAIIKDAGVDGIRIGDIQSADRPEYGKKPWAHRSRVKRLVDFLRGEDVGVVRVVKNRAFHLTDKPDPDLSKVMASGHESELYPLLLQNQVIDEILSKGRDSDAFDDVRPEQIAYSEAIASARGKGVRLGLPDFIWFVNRSIQGIPFVESHSFEIKNSRGAHREVIFQALGQRALGIYSHTWIIAVIDAKAESSDQIHLLESDCLETGIGLIVISEEKLADELTATECLKIWPRNVAIDPRRQIEHFTQLGVLEKMRDVLAATPEEL